MFNLSNASQGIRKAAALKGIRSGQWEPVFTPEPTDEFGSVIARVHGDNGKVVEITASEAEYADSRTWKQIKAKA
ncbi:MAG: hypothetical protein KDE20_19795 [Caldilineaceae bacterium]|nr:hypothetical protein [Caldilineaceae bacterium]